MAFFKKRERAEPEQIPKENDCEDLLISTYLGRNNITREMAEEIPAIQGNLDLIVKTAANVPIGNVSRLFPRKRWLLLCESRWTGNQIFALCRSKKCWNCKRSRCDF